MKFSRFGFLRAFAAGSVLPLFYPLLDKLSEKTGRRRKILRPPGAKPEEEFLKDCIACGQCANVCPNQCIKLSDLDDGLENLGTPVINPRAQACILCMACTQVCPTQALEKLPATKEGMRAVKMDWPSSPRNTATLFPAALAESAIAPAPLPGEAMTLGLYEQPHVHAEHCVGCGLCEQACVKMPQAIRIVPFAELARQAAEDEKKMLEGH